jgi:hypothetical protein
MTAAMRDFSSGPSGCRSTPRRCANNGSSTASSTSARVAASTPSHPGGTRSPRWAWRCWPDNCVTPASACRATAAAASSRRPMRPACRPRSTTTGAPSTRPCTLGAPCLVLVVGSLPGALEGRPLHKDIARARREVQRRHRRHAGLRTQRPDAAGDRAAAPDAGGRARLHQHAGAGAGRLRRARPRAQRRARRRRRHVPRVVGPQARNRRSRAPAASGCWPSTSATG